MMEKMRVAPIVVVLAAAAFAPLAAKATVQQPPGARTAPRVSPPPAAQPAPQTASTAADPLRFEVELSPTAVEEMRVLGLEAPATGRVFVVVTRDSAREPRRQVSVTGVPFWGKDVRGFAPGAPDTLADGVAGVRGYPLERIDALPPGEYYVQALLNVYTTYRRADGRVLELHHETGEGQDPWTSPGNAHSAVQRVRLDPAAGGTVRLVLGQVIPPIEPVPPGGVPDQGNPQDTEHVRFVKIRSLRVSDFWGRDMYVGANVLLPAGYEENPDARYPVIYLQGHFPGRSAPFGYVEEGDEARGRAAGFSEFWRSERAPRVIVVTIRDANPYYDTSYSVNSANVGPYGDAIVHELIPHLEPEFRAIAEPWARVLAGGSTGGWEALALQVWYPDDFGGAWGWCPDPVDFHYYQIVNVYEDANAYQIEYPWLTVERPSNRRPDGNIRYTMRQENHFELAVGPDSRSAGQWAIWEAVFGPVGADGYPARIWDPVTGVIDRDVAEYWRRNYDLHHFLRENWQYVGSKLAGKLHIATGDMDSYYLDNAVYRLQEFLDSTTNPAARATFEYGRRKPHCWIGHSREQAGEDLDNAEFVRIAAEYMARNAPEGTDASAWLR